MKISIPELTALPAGTGYNSRSGQLTVDVRRAAGDSIQVTAVCDSLARQVILKEEELVRIRNETSVKEKPPDVIHEPTGWQWFWIRTGQLAIAVLVVSMIKWYLNKKIKRWKK